MIPVRLPGRVNAGSPTGGSSVVAADRIADDVALTRDDDRLGRLRYSGACGWHSSGSG
jgi:hypothetical protein